MKLVLQRVNWANISCISGNDIEMIGTIQRGVVVYIGFEKGDYERGNKFLLKAFQRIKNLPLFEDESGRIKKSLKDIDGEILLIPNFTLVGQNKKGNSINYANVEDFEKAKELFEQLYVLLKKEVKGVVKGCFGKYMKIQSEVDGPVNLVLDFK